MSAEIKSHVTELLTLALAKVAPQQPASIISLDRPKQSQHGDYSVNVALQLAKPLGRGAREIAQDLVTAIPRSDWLAGAEVAGPGFINIRLHPVAKQFTVKTVLGQGARYGQSVRGQNQPVIVEFVSANPTGPLHVGHGRQAALGDAISALLESQGYQVAREFYYNDAGAQIENLALSVQARIRESMGEPVEFPADGYHGEYIREIAEKYIAGSAPDANDLDAICRFAVSELRAEQDLDLRAFGVTFDNYYLESSLYRDSRVEQTVAALVSAEKTYEQDGALWLRTTEYGDDKDRVMRKSDGSYTYFVPDVAYHITKWERGFKRAINVQGSDHHSTVTRVRAGLQALSSSLCPGIGKGYPEYVLHKMVTVMRGGEEVKISKRAGTYVTLRDLIDEVGCDATRFFLVSRRADTEFVFDVDLAKSQSEENPVYYVQYAHARICSVLEQWGVQFAGTEELEAARAAAKESTDTYPESFLKDVDPSPLTGPREFALLAKLGEYPQMLENACKELAPHQVAFYLRELAGDFHSYYNAERILVPQTPLRLARLALVAGVRQVMRNGLDLMGVSAPDKM
ncbi:MAG: arginine--tRNA ligase [Betaproteobacteria bacterium RIFCSPLOWO2_12_FULL_63_13]|nr:MAG: arginine--tRNA ligase [Betaproteobacteria bacterium RIFCSPLOWO2_02_FULL_63_19]OGA47281.1 MAG: arginine--tRNA ligase [Betaproteobacteria bacterium RIFCSPLOWO2_12_FULL_63_13]